MRKYTAIGEIAIKAALYHKELKPTEDVLRVRDMRDDTSVQIGWEKGKAFVMAARAALPVS